MQKGFCNSAAKESARACRRRGREAPGARGQQVEGLAPDHKGGRGNRAMRGAQPFLVPLPILLLFLVGPEQRVWSSWPHLFLHHFLPAPAAPSLPLLIGGTKPTRASTPAVSTSARATRTTSLPSITPPPLQGMLGVWRRLLGVLGWEGG